LINKILDSLFSKNSNKMYESSSYVTMESETSFSLFTLEVFDGKTLTFG